MSIEEKVKQLKSSILEGFELALTLNPSYTREQFLEVVKKEHQNLVVKFNAIQRSGQHPSEDLRVGILAHSQIIKEA